MPNSKPNLSLIARIVLIWFLATASFLLDEGLIRLAR